jgi:hypothetical protein
MPAKSDSKPKPIKIDVSGVPPERRTDTKFLELCKEVQGLFPILVVVNSFCVHESAHIFYYQQAGINVHSVVGPSITYDPTKKEKFGFRPAQVLVKKSDIEALGTDTSVVRKIAKVHASGAVVAKALTSVKVGGGEGDREIFNAFCVTAKVSETDGEKIWMEAEDEIRKDSRKRAIQTELWNKAYEIRLQLFDIPFPQGLKP